MENLTDTSTKYKHKIIKRNGIFYKLRFEIRLQSIQFRPGVIPPLQVQYKRLRLFYQCSKKHEYSLRIHITKYHFAKIEIDWLGYKYSQSGISP